MSIDLSRIRRRCERVVRMAAPVEFGTKPIYCIFDTELPTDVRLDPGVMGRVWANFDLCLRPFIQQWRGRGPCFVLSGSMLNEAPTQRHANAAAVGIALHEAAHLLNEGSIEWSDETAQPAPDMPSPAEAMVSQSPPDDLRRVMLYANLYAHDHRFIRALCHARYRASIQGIATGSLYLGVMWGIAPCMSNLYHYDVDLLSEMKAMRGATFAEILAMPAPLKFARRWNDDVAEVVRTIGGKELAADLKLDASAELAQEFIQEQFT